MLPDKIMEVLNEIQRSLFVNTKNYAPAYAMATNNYGCTSRCSGDCSGDCAGDCYNTCYGACDGDCAGTCMTTCEWASD